MAIDTGLAIGCTDLQATGGISQILLREWTTTDVVTYDTSTPSVHSILSILDASPATTADWFVYEFKNETPSLTIAATKENGSTSFECGLSFFLPKLEYNKFSLIESITNSCLMVIAVDNNDTAFVLGVSEKYENTADATRNQTYAQLAGVEAASGAAYSDESGVTISLTARQFELPLEYTGAITVVAGDLTATTS